MPDLTDDELGTLLRETFADREARVGHAVLDDHYVPTATKRRGLTPVLLAAAMVLVVLGGVLYGVQRVRPADTVQPAATVTAAPADYTTRDAEIWGLAIGVMLRRFQLPAKPTSSGPFTRAIVLDRPAAAASRMQLAQRFSVAQRAVIVSHTLRILPVTFLDPPLPADANCAKYPKTAMIVVSEVLDKGDHLEVGVALSTSLGCRGTATSLRYRVEPRGAHWVITQTLGVWNR
ncbi:hypothetical protein ACXJJ3_19780 [Kribbella sp. WER1]